jgi:hypothetical protein
MTPDALHRGGFTGDPHPGIRHEISAANRGNERVAGWRVERQVAPLDVRARMLGQ